MNKIIYSVLLAAFSIASAGCSGDAQNTNQTDTVNINAATATPAPTATAANTAVNAAKVEETPLPQFTNADEAIAEGTKQLDANSTEKAIEAYKQAVKLNPDSGEAYFRLGIAYAQIEKIAKDKALTEVETEPTPKPAKAKASKKSKNGKYQPPAPTTDSEKAFAEAVKAYKKFLVKNPKDDAAHYNLGRAYNKLNDDDNALKSLQQAVKLKPEDTEYQTELGAIYIKLAKYDDAVKALKKALEIDSQNLQADELLEKAAAGKKRVDFGVPKNGASEKNVPVRENSKPRKNSAPKEATKPETKSETPNANK